MDIISFSKHILDHRIDRRKEHSVETIVYIAMAAVIIVTVVLIVMRWFL